MLGVQTNFDIALTQLEKRIRQLWDVTEDGTKSPMSGMCTEHAAVFPFNLLTSSGS